MQIDRIKAIGKPSTLKRVLVLAGIHGNEITPLKTCMDLVKLYKETQDVDITFINGINREGLLKNVRECVKEQPTQDLNRSFYQTPPDYVSFIKQEIDNHDVIIDIHSSPMCKELVLVDINEYTPSYLAYLKSLHIQPVTRYSTGNTIKKYCNDLNKIAFTVELNGIGVIDEDSVENGVVLVVRLIDNIERLTLEPNQTYYNLKELASIKSPEEGLLYFSKELGSCVKSGDYVGHILKLDGNKVKIHSPIKGTLVCGNDKQYVGFGESIVEIYPD